jgi:hypothetical protein
MLFQQPHKLIFKCHLPVVLFLMRNVMFHRSQIRLAHAEISISLLPCKLPSVLVHPPRGIRLDQETASATDNTGGN